MTKTSSPEAKGNLREQTAYWVSTDTILTSQHRANHFELHYAPDGSLTIEKHGIISHQSFELRVIEEHVSEHIRNKFPHLSHLTALRVPETAVRHIDDLLRGQVALQVSDLLKNPITATGLQIPGVLDERYSYDGPLGPDCNKDGVTFRLWAPTAKAVRVEGQNNVDMMRNDATGVWQFIADSSWIGTSYRYEVEVFVPREGKVLTNIVTDPYSTGLTTNSLASIALDLKATDFKPDGWDRLVKPQLDAFVDVTLYELHVRDFSIIDKSIPEAERGTFKAFTHFDGNGMRHLQRLSQCGLSHIHLLPVFDIATINEDRKAQRAPTVDFLSGFEGDSDEQQRAIYSLRHDDGYNWGYDPFHYTVPEGSYSTDPEGGLRTLEFREMVQALNQVGLRVVMDVVYNHTNASGQDDKSVLDKIVPGYYHRLDNQGRVENSTCCSNTATEHTMMRKLMIDSVLTWARAYKVDGFRFDLMGHHMKIDMITLRDALNTLTIDRDGVNGKKIVLYGEGWDFGEVAGGMRGINATQMNMSGTGIATFNDRLRDAVRGGSAFGGIREQGFGSGLLTHMNETWQGDMAMVHERLGMYSDRIRIGLTGNNADYELVNFRGERTCGKLIDYNGMSCGYTCEPDQVVNYVSAHDNETLFDSLQYKLPIETCMTDRVRYQILSLSIVMFSQGMKLFHAGCEVLRSKSMDRDSYNSGDWFNAMDWTYVDNNWAKGLPVAEKNEGNWKVIRTLLCNESLKARKVDIMRTLSGFETLLKIRKSCGLLRLRSAEQVATRLKFHNVGREQMMGVIVMSVDGSGDRGIDARFNRVVVVLNGRDEKVEVRVKELEEVDMEVHAMMREAGGFEWGEMKVGNGKFSVPAVRTGVFVERV